MNFVNEFGEKRNGFAEVVAFCHMTCRYFDRFLLQGVDKNWRQACLFYVRDIGKLILEGRFFALRTLTEYNTNASKVYMLSLYSYFGRNKLMF